MRILVLSTWFPRPHGNGSMIRAYHLLCALGSRHQVYLVAFQPESSSLDDQNLVGDLPVTQARPVAVDPFRYVNLPQALKFCSPIPLAYWPSRHMRQVVAQMAREGRWDAVVCIQAHGARYAAQLAGVPGILDMDTSLSYQSYERYRGQERPLGRLRMWASWKKTERYERHLLRAFRACTLVSPVEVGYIQKLAGQSSCDIEIIANGVDCEHNRLGLVPSTPGSLVYNGSLTYSANYDAMRFFLADIYPAIRRQVPGVSLTVTGSLAGVDCSGLALDDSVRLTGHVADVRLPVAGASVCVVPIREGGGTRLKILEAMALGTPVVATSKGAEGLNVTPGQDILIADEPADFAAQVVRLVESGPLRAQLSANARRLVTSQYDWEQIGQRFATLVDQVVKGGAKAPGQDAS